MQQALPYRDYLLSTAAGTSVSPPATTTSDSVLAITDANSVRHLVAENAVVVFARRDCCMCHVVKLLLLGHGVYPSIYDFDEQNESDVIKELSTMIDGAAPQFPAVFVGGELFGGLEDVMAAHISGELVPRLREAGALWL